MSALVKYFAACLLLTAASSSLAAQRVFDVCALYAPAHFGNSYEVLGPNEMRSLLAETKSWGFNRYCDWFDMDDCKDPFAAGHTYGLGDAMWDAKQVNYRSAQDLSLARLGHHAEPRLFGSVPARTAGGQGGAGVWPVDLPVESAGPGDDSQELRESVFGHGPRGRAAGLSRCLPLRLRRLLLPAVRSVDSDLRPADA